MEGVVGPEEVAQAAASFVGLVPAIGRELYSVIGYGLVDLAVLWAGTWVSWSGWEMWLIEGLGKLTIALRLRMAN